MIATPLDDEFLQHSFDPNVAGRCLLVIGVVKGECLIERKQMLGAIVASECLCDHLSAGVATVMAQARQRLRIAFAGKDRANDAQAGQSSDVGDNVVVSYYQGLAAQVLPPGTAVTDDVKQMDVATAAEPGTKPGAGIGTALKATVVIEKVDTQANTVTFKRPDGVSRTLPVQSDEGKAFIKKLKAGDKVDVVYAEAVAVEVKPAAKK